MTLHVHELFAAVVAACVCFTAEGPARADEPSAEARSKALFADARQLSKDGKYEQACPKFEEALRLHVGIGTQFNLADCWEHQGRLASAHALFLGVVASAHAAGQSEREELARQRATALEPRLSHLTIEVHAKDEKLTVRQNEVPLEPSAFGVDRAVDPGKYTIAASAPGKQSFSREVELSDKPVTISIPELAAIQDASAKDDKKHAEACLPASEASAKKAAAKPRRPAPEHHTRVVSRRPEYVLPLAAVGASGLVAGTLLGLKYRSANEFATTVCPAQVGCTANEIADHQHAVSDAKMFRTWSLIGFGIGGAALAGATVLYLNPKVERVEERAWSAEPVVGSDGSFGLVARGRF